MTSPSKLPTSAQDVPPPSLPISSGSRSTSSYLPGSQKEDSAVSSQSIKGNKRNREPFRGVSRVESNSEEILNTKPMNPSDHVSKDLRGFITVTTDSAIEDPAFGPRESNVPQVTLTPPPSDTQTLLSLSP
ncbi:hypothetical protein LWI29_002621 [Acer saccharum]|uniref:Uncharacterized protein n=1 Tax=Acer saccharum TaxID=4024 RepID=A0AA39RKB0_ACESA|nr:hypothetical protein LWI29_002621 [Acer saccharum]